MGQGPGGPHQAGIDPPAARRRGNRITRFGRRSGSGKKPAVISALASGLLSLSHPTLAVRVSIRVMIGSLMIIAMSAWLNATALAGAAALEQHLANTLQGYSRDLDQAHRYAISAQSLLPDLQMASGRFGQLADGERTGTLTGTSGSGTVVQLLSQMSNELGALSRTVEQSREQVTALYDQGGKHLAKMRELVSSRGPIGPRSDAFGTEATALLGVIASLQQTSIASAVKRTSDGLAAGFIAPAAAGRTAELAERQTAVVDRVQEAVSAQSKALSAAADKILNDKTVGPLQFVPR